MRPERVPFDMVQQMMTLSDMAEAGDGVTEEVARRVISDWLNRAPELLSEAVECPDCFALVRPERRKAHERWHALDPRS